MLVFQKDGFLVKERLVFDSDMHNFPIHLDFQTLVVEVSFRPLAGYVGDIYSIFAFVLIRPKGTVLGELDVIVAAFVVYEGNIEFSQVVRAVNLGPYYPGTFLFFDWDIIKLRCATTETYYLDG